MCAWALYLCLGTILGKEPVYSTISPQISFVSNFPSNVSTRNRLLLHMYQEDNRTPYSYSQIPHYGTSTQPVHLGVSPRIARIKSDDIPFMSHLPLHIIITKLSLLFSSIVCKVLHIISRDYQETTQSSNIPTVIYSLVGFRKFARPKIYF